jgi:hypothetical protein
MEYTEQIQAWGAGGVEEERAVGAELGVGARDLDKGQTLLAELGLGSAEVVALKRQGFVSCEARGGGKIVYKLRFRLVRRLRVKCLGAVEEFAKRVEESLARLQHPRHKALAIGRLQREAARLLLSTASGGSSPGSAPPAIAFTGRRFGDRGGARRRKFDERIGLEADSQHPTGKEPKNGEAC